MKILVSIDLSSSTPHLLNYTKQLAQSLFARVCLLHVTDSQQEILGYGGVFGEFPMYIDAKELRQEIATRFHHEHQQMLQFSQQLQADGLHCVGLLVSGTSVVTTIIKEAEKLSADMIIIGSEHKGLWTQLIEGSTSKSLVGQSTVPVLVVPVKA
jgi:nucleotide-binding universal stress UspA family protein